MCNLIRNTLDAYKGAKPDSPEGRLMQKMEDIYRKLQEAFASGAYEAGTNFQKAENTTGKGGVRYAIAGQLLKQEYQTLCF